MLLNQYFLTRSFVFKINAIASKMQLKFKITTLIRKIERYFYIWKSAVHLFCSQLSNY